jgi:hypothetical protein
VGTKKRVLRQADEAAVDALLVQLRERILSASDGTNALWRAQQLIIGISNNERAVKEESVTGSKVRMTSMWVVRTNMINALPPKVGT